MEKLLVLFIDIEFNNYYTYALYSGNIIMADGASGGGAKGNPDAIPERWLCDVKARGGVN